uniref:RING finger protein 145 n=2 Tax=Colobinae TaxID=9569 RepID=A0A8C9GU91_9PRIM
MAYMICQFFHMDFWLLIIISSSILTSLQVLGTLFIYVLFMVEEFRKEPVENMDDVIYYVNGTYRLLEFLVALCVVAYGVSETIFGEWTVMGSMIIFIHSYYNVWLRAQLGWKSFLLRRDAVNKIKSLPIATKEQLEKHNDICAICYQDMKSAVITPCSHFFHAGCLKKWLYVQETCPLCHCHLKNSSQLPGLGTEPVLQPHAGAEQNVMFQEEVCEENSTSATSETAPDTCEREIKSDLSVERTKEVRIKSMKTAWEEAGRSGTELSLSVGQINLIINSE